MIIRKVVVSILAVNLLLAGDAIGRPWNGGEALLVDLFVAAKAVTIGAIIEPVQGGFDRAQLLHFAIDLRNGQVALLSQLDRFHLVGRSFNDDVVEPIECTR
jgi:hypothetical protein